MELLVAFVINNFWMLVLLFTFLICRPYRVGGILILMVLIFTGGSIPYWVLGIIVILTVFTLYLKPYNLYKNRYNKKVDLFYKKVQLEEKKKRRMYKIQQQEQQQADVEEVEDLGEN